MSLSTKQRICLLFWDELLCLWHSWMNNLITMFSHSAMVTLCNPVDCNSPGSSVYGVFQARILKWVAISFSSGSSRPRDQTWVSCISQPGRHILYHYIAWEVINPYGSIFLFLLFLRRHSYLLHYILIFNIFYRLLICLLPICNIASEFFQSLTSPLLPHSLHA